MVTKSKATLFPPCNRWLNFCLRGQFEIKILIVQHIKELISYELKKWTLACVYLKRSNLSADNSKTILELDGSIPEPAIRSGDTGQRIPCFDSCQLISTFMCNMSAISGCSWAPKLTRKCKIKHWFSWGVNGQSFGVRSRHTKFSRMGMVLRTRAFRFAIMQFFWQPSGGQKLFRVKLTVTIFLALVQPQFNYCSAA